MTKKEMVYKYLVDNSFGTAPSVRELCAEFNIKSTSTVFDILHSLEEEGLITLDKGKRRNITVVGKKNIKPIPLLGTVAAGVPILAQQNIEEYITFEITNDAYEYFALRVKGDSMVNAGIVEGDVVIVKRIQSVDDGDIVVALIDDEATVKRIFHMVKYVELRAENENYPPIVTEIFSVLGKVVALRRDFE